MPRAGITGQKARPEEPDRISRAQGDVICPAGGIIWGKILRMGCGGDSGTPWRGETRSNETHASTTDADARLYKKAAGQAAKLCHMGHVLMENRNGLAGC